MVKVILVSDSAILSKKIGIKLISKGYYANHIFSSHLVNQNFENFVSSILKDAQIIVFDHESTRKTLDTDKVREIIEKISKISKNLIFISSEKDLSIIKSWSLMGLKGIVDSSLNSDDLSEKVYEVIFSIPISDNDKRKHYRVKVPNGSTAKIFVNQDITLLGSIFDVSAGGVSVVFKSDEETNSLISNKPYSSQLDFEGISISAKLFLVRREEALCGFRFFNLDDRQLVTLSEYIYHRIIEDTYNDTLISK
jgi:hypothetical protein